MDVPILEQRDYLVASIHAMHTDEDLTQLRERLLEKAAETQSRGVILDVTGIDVMDSFSVRVFRDLAQMVAMRGGETVIVGIQPEVAFSMVQLGLRLEGIKTALDLEEGLDYLDARTTGPQDRGRGAQ